MRSLSQLHNYQKQAIIRMLNSDELALFHDLGLGKTIVSLVTSKRLIMDKRVKRILIVAPLSVIYNVWEQEAKKWAYTSDLKFSVLHGSEKAGRLGSADNIFLINYEGIIWLCDHLRRHYKIFPFDMVIFDESSKLKSSRTKRFKTLKGLINRFKRRYLLTASPASNSLMDLWSQFYIMEEGKTFGKSFGRFQRRYFHEAYPYKWILNDGSKKEIYHKAAPKVDRLEAKDYLEIPKITYNIIPLHFPPFLEKKYNELENEFFLKLKETEIEVFNMAALSMKLRQFIQGGLYDSEKVWHNLHKIKLNALKDLVNTSVGQPILCAIQFRGELTMIQKVLGKIPVIAGGTPISQAREYIKKWNKGLIPFLVCHPASLSHGVNLQSGGHILLWYGLTYSLEQYLQLNGRLHRQGQNNRVIIHHLIIQNTIDVVLLKALKDKAVNQNDLLNYFKKWQAFKQNK